MPTIEEIQVHYRRSKDDETEMTAEKPKSQETNAIKFQVAAIVNGIRSMLTKDGYFYVVMKARKSDGSTGYRTVVPKTFPNK